MGILGHFDQVLISDMSVFENTWYRLKILNETGDVRFNQLNFSALSVIDH